MHTHTYLATLHHEQDETQGLLKIYIILAHTHTHTHTRTYQENEVSLKLLIPRPCSKPQKSNLAIKNNNMTPTLFAHITLSIGNF